MARRVAFLLLSWLALYATPANSAPQILQIAGLEVAAWMPSVIETTPPVIIFSHGFHGCNTQSKFLMEALAEAGYAVFAPNHADAACGDIGAWFDRSEKSFRKPEEWDDKVYADRGKDIRILLDALMADRHYAKYDWNHVGLAGHSLGGYTVLAIGGAWPSWRDNRVKAVLALSPFTAPFIQQKTLSHLQIPVMYQGGTRDVGITPLINKGNGAYPQTPAPKYYVEFRDAGHFAWTDLRDRFRSSIEAYSIAFFDHTLKYKPFPQDLTVIGNDVSDFRMKEQ